MNKEMGLWTPDGFISDETIRSKLLPTPLFDRSTEYLKQSQEMGKERIGVEEATWVIPTEKPVAVLLMTDIHYGALGTDYSTLVEHLNTVEDTNGMYFVTNGDHVDNFNAIGKLASAMMENPLPPQKQTAAFMEKLRSLDKKKKLGVMSYGNHEGFMSPSGYDWFESFAQGLNAPVFTSGGLLHIMVGRQQYDMAIQHRHWGTSKLNPTNACKRLMEHEYPDADILFLGHTHQSEALKFDRGGKTRIACIGGTYKAHDTWATQVGIGRHPGSPGMCLLLSPSKHNMEIVSIDTAKEIL